MALKLIAAAAALSFVAHAALADEPDPVNQLYLVIGSGGISHRVCHCSSEAPPDFYLNPNVSLGGETLATRLHRLTCVFTTGELVWIHNTDGAVTANGTIE